MKKVMKCLGMMALVALAFASCSKNDEKTSFRGTTEQLNMSDENRAYIDNALKIHFEVGDKCMLFNISKLDPSLSDCAAYEAVEDGTTVRFENSGDGEINRTRLDDAYYAYYPAGQDRIKTNLAGGENKAKFFVSPKQVYRVDAATGEPRVSMRDMYMAAKSEAATFDSDIEFVFNNVCGVLKLRPWQTGATKNITKIEIVDNLPLTGWVELIIPEVDVDEMRAAFDHYFDPSYAAQLAAYRTRLGFKVTGPNYGHTVTLYVDDPETTEVENAPIPLGTNASNAPAFYFVLRPLALYTGCHMHFYFDDGTDKDCVIPAGIEFLKMRSNYLADVDINLGGF